MFYNLIDLISSQSIKFIAISVYFFNDNSLIPDFRKKRALLIAYCSNIKVQQTIIGNKRSSFKERYNFSAV